MHLKKGQIVSSHAGVVRLVQIHDGDGWKATDQVGQLVTLKPGDIAPASPDQVQAFVAAQRARKGS